VKVHSQEGTGSCFTISLPVSKEVQYGHGSESVRC
jgi:signal transduction histidine kinase